MRAVASLVLLLLATSAYPCTTFCLARDGEAVFGRNYDFEIGQGFVMTNHRGVRKTSVDGTLAWVSRYGSVTFNQWGREFPMDGMNEAGLVVALMWLDETVYPVDERPRLRVLEWIQYQLDNYGTVTELLERIEETRIGGGTPLHYLIADSTGAAATVEYLQGRLVVHSGAQLPAAALTNDSYARSLQHLRGYAGFGGTRRAPTGFSSLDRFVRAAMLMREASGSRSVVDETFDILGSVAQPGWTRWSIVYDMRRMEVSWKTLTSATRKRIRLDELDLACAAPAKMLDINSQVSGDVAMESYSPAANRDLVVSSYASTSFTRNNPTSWAEADAAHAESFSCMPQRRRRATIR